MPPSVTTEVQAHKFTGHLGNLSPQQAEALEQFRKELKDEGVFNEDRHDDDYLLRFLRARKFDLVKTKKMFIDCENWRKDFGVDESRMETDGKGESQPVDKNESAPGKANNRRVEFIKL